MNYKVFFGNLCLAALTIISFNSCSMEDDIQAIFVGKTWHLINFFTTTNWKNENISKAIYRTDDEEGQEALKVINQNNFNITFHENTFVARAGSRTFEGTWQADGKNSTIAMYVTQGEPPTGTSTSDRITREFYNIINDSGFYIGNTLYLKLFQSDKKVFMQFTKDK